MVTLYPDDKSDAATLSGDDYTPDPQNPPPDYSEAAATTLGNPSQSTPRAFSDHGGSSTSESVPPGRSTARFAFAPLARPTNFLNIEHDNSSIYGTYSIDPTLSAPPGVVKSLKSQAEDGRDLNLQLITWNGSIKVVIDVVRGVDSKGPARLETNSQNGHVDVTVYDRGQNRFRLQVITQNGSATIRIPSTFIGSVHSKMQNGRVRFNPEVRRHVTTLSEIHDEGSYFIGDFATHGYRDEQTRNMDHLYIESQNGDATIKFASDEPPNTRAGTGGFFSRLFYG